MRSELPSHRSTMDLPVEQFSRIFRRWLRISSSWRICSRRSRQGSRPLNLAAELKTKKIILALNLMR